MLHKQFSFIILYIIYIYIYITNYLVVDNYNIVLSSLLDSHAPLMTDYATTRILQPWMSGEILSVKRKKRKSERIWRKTN